MKPSLAQKIVLEGIRPHKPVYVTPYGLSGVGQAVRLNDAATAYHRVDDVKGEAGGDLKYSPTNNLTLSSTAAVSA